MSRNWQNIFQSGQGMSETAIAQLSGIEVDLATTMVSVLPASNGVDDTITIQAALDAGGTIAG
ncbi:MAG TPA: hypothetical protein VIY48_02595, partial [Candidatus Paceibacterota bacterium]